MASNPRKVAVIGAGVSGLTAAKHLKEYGLEVVLFERSAHVAGIWSYDERKPLDASYPSIRPFLPDLEHASNDAEDFEYQKLVHAPPSAAYSSLTNNVSTKLSTLNGQSWPAGTPDFVNVRVIETYLQDYTETFDLESLIRYDTSVEEVKKNGARWKVTSTTLTTTGLDRGKKTTRVEEFDSIVVASGHYNDGVIPDIPGLSQWKQTWPRRVHHSKLYRTPDEFKDQTVLLIGAGVSSSDIAREIGNGAKQIYQATRQGKYDLPVTWLPENAERVSQVVSFVAPEDSSSSGRVTLSDGRVLENIDRVIICTGYHNSFPFLSGFHSNTVAREDADQEILVTDGSQVHNLYLDIFYIPDSTLAFVGLPYQIPTFKTFEFQSIAVAAVLAGKARLPPTETMRAQYRSQIEAKGFGRDFHVLGKALTVPYINDLVAWINREAEETGGKKVDGLSEAWLEELQVLHTKISAKFDRRSIPGTVPEAELLEAPTLLPWDRSESQDVSKKRDVTKVSEIREQVLRPVVA